MVFKKILHLFCAFMLLAALSLFAAAADITKDVDITFENIRGARLTDGKIDTFASGENVKIEITSQTPLGGVWLRYSQTPVGGVLNGETKICENGFWSEFIPLENLTATVTFDAVSICEMNVYSKGEIPSEVQRWSLAQYETDLMLFAAHSDDDQLFFAGLVPYYIAKGDVDVKVCFFTTSYQDISRVQELLAGLWHCGLKNYPIILPLPDEYSESIATAKAQLANAGYPHKDVCALAREVLNTYTPQVAVVHDFDGEYGHGMHRLSAAVIKEVIETATENDFVPPKAYSHLFAQNEIVLPIDEVLEPFGKSAFNISQEAFNFHKSQHWTWFYGWLYGENRPVSAASQIRTYNPAKYGLFHTLVGLDTENDMLENIEIFSARNTHIELNEENRVQADIYDNTATDATNAPTDTKKEPPHYNNVGNIATKTQTKGIGMRFLLFPAIVIAILVAILVILWIIEDKPFVEIYPEDYE